MNQGFVSKYEILLKVLKTIPKSNSFGLYSEIDSIEEFKEIVRKISDKEVYFLSRTLNESLPQLWQSIFTLRNKDGKHFLFAGSTEFEKKKSFLKARGELLERVSAHSRLSNTGRKKYLSKSALGYRYKFFPTNELYFGLNNPHKKNQRNAQKQITTNGCAGYFQYDNAILGGWLELVQRDSFLMYWLNSIPPRIIDIESYIKKSRQIEMMVGKIKDYNLKYYFLDITSDIGVPVCVCVLITQSETGERVSIGAGAGFSAEQILSSAFSEAISIMNYIHGISPITLHKKYEPFTDSKIDRDMRIRLYCNNEMFEKFKFFISSKETVSVEDFITVGKTISVPANDTRSQLVYLKKIFRERYKENKDYDVFVYKIKNKLLEEFDYKVVRIVCDGLYSLYLNENFADPNHPRLKEFVKNKGLEKVAKLNIWPHPFP